MFVGSGCIGAHGRSGDAYSLSISSAACTYKVQSQSPLPPDTYKHRPRARCRYLIIPPDASIKPQFHADIFDRCEKLAVAGGENPGNNILVRTLTLTLASQPQSQPCPSPRTSVTLTADVLCIPPLKEGGTEVPTRPHTPPMTMMTWLSAPPPLPPLPTAATDKPDIRAHFTVAGPIGSSQAAMPELAHVFEADSVTRALNSVLGEDYLMHGHRCELH